MFILNIRIINLLQYVLVAARRKKPLLPSSSLFYIIKDTQGLVNINNIFSAQVLHNDYSDRCFRD